MKKRTLIKLIIFYLILITLIAVMFGALLSVKVKPINTYICSNGLIATNPSSCSTVISFEESGEEIIFFNTNSKNQFETCIMHLEGKLLADAISLDIGNDGSIDETIEVYETFEDFENISDWGDGDVTLSDGIKNNSIKKIFANPWQMICREGVFDLSEYKRGNYSVAFWSKTNNTNDNFARIEFRGDDNCRETFFEPYGSEDWSLFLF